ncbi:MAG: PilC/PilY family type IV pilus protein [Chromatiales bacterium]
MSKASRKSYLFTTALLLAICQVPVKLQAGVVVEQADWPIWNISPYELSNEHLHLAPGQAFQPTYQYPGGSGNLYEWQLDRYTGRSAGWDAQSALLAQEKENPDFWKARKIILLDASGRQQGFWWDQLASPLRQLLDERSAMRTGPEASPVLNYLRGDRSGEGSGGFRIRRSLLGDIINANPVYVGAPEESYDDSPLLLRDYAIFRRDNAGRNGRVYVGASDGMLHAFDADNGREVWTYLPAMIDFSKLANLVRIPYVQTALLNGELVATDAVAGGEWRTLLAGGLGAGGKGFFILDVTTPDLEDISADRKILAEFDESDPDLGYIQGPASIVLMEDDAWYLVTGNGFLPDNRDACLYLVPLADISNTSPIRIRVPERATGGLAAPAVIDSDGNGKADIAYAGDLAGNLWKFDLVNRSIAEHQLYDAGEKQPVTTRPEVAAHPDGGFMVYFGTGSLLSDKDAANMDRQSIYAIHDYPGRSRTVVETDLQSSADLELEEVLAHGKRLRVGGSHRPTPSATRGWKVDLPEAGERLLQRPLLRGGRLQFISTHGQATNGHRAPASWYMELDWLGGGSAGRAISDFNGDGMLDDQDMVNHKGVMVSAVGEYLGSGLFSRIRLAHTASGSDVAFINGLEFGRKALALQGERHFDVDTDDVLQDGLGAKTGQHTHEYDSTQVAREIGYFDPGLGAKGHSRLDLSVAAHLGEDELFILTLANADLSPGAVITLELDGVERQWNVLDYQKLVQKRLESYDGTKSLLDHFLDPRGYPLVFAMPGGPPSSAVLDNLKITLREDAWSTGALLGTRPECVSADPHAATPHRWRGGALTLHAIKAESLKSQNWPGEEKAWVVQDPPDLASSAEGFGGVHANPENPVGFLYESTLFWHYPGDLCYGEPGWAPAFLNTTGAVTEAVIFAMLSDNDAASDVDSFMQVIAEISALTCDQGRGFLCNTDPVYLEGRELLDAHLDFREIENAALMHEGILATVETPGPDMEESNDLARIIAPKAPPVIENLDTHRSWTDIEF